jgi:hypothetical protein
MRRRAPALAVIVALAVPALAGRQVPLPDEIGWVALYNRQLLEWLENVNRLDQLCPPSVDVTVERDCRAGKRRPLPYFVPLRNAPSAGADEVGKLMLLAVPGEPLASYYLDADRDDARAFTPDLYLADWGYGPYHHQTYLERRGDWFRLPEDPFPPGAWIDARAFGEPPTVAMLETERVYRSPRGQIVVLAEDADGIRARAEQPADMWCEAGDPPPSAPAPAFRIPKRELYSDTGHLLIAPAYMKGC